MNFEYLNELKLNRLKRLNLNQLMIVNKRPDIFSVSEWIQVLGDNYKAMYCIENYLEIPEEIEYRIIQNQKKLIEFFK